METATTPKLDVLNLPRRLYRALTAGKEELYQVLEDSFDGGAFLRR